MDRMGNGRKCFWLVFSFFFSCSFSNEQFWVKIAAVSWVFRLGPKTRCAFRVFSMYYVEELYHPASTYTELQRCCIISRALPQILLIFHPFAIVNQFAVGKTLSTIHHGLWCLFKIFRPIFWLISLCYNIF